MSTMPWLGRSKSEISVMTTAMSSGSIAFESPVRVPQAPAL